jgi:hypothetical protein
VLLPDSRLQLLSEGYEAMGWRKYKSGKCSYKGYRTDCPSKHHKHRHEEDWDNKYGELPCCCPRCWHYASTAMAAHLQCTCLKM